VTPPQAGWTRAESPVAGLRRRGLTLTQVLAQSVAAVAPSAAMVTLPGIVIAEVGSAAIACFVVAAAIVFLVGYCLSHFARRMASASGLYSYTAKGLGPVAAFTAGWALMIGYLGIALASVLASALYISSLIGLVGLAPAGSTVVLSAAIPVLAGLAALLMVRGIKLSARVALGLEVTSIALILAALAILKINQAEGITAPPAATGRLSIDAVGLGVVLAVTSFVGFESAGTLGVEAKRPLVSIARAMRWLPLALGVLYLVAVTAQVATLAAAPLDIWRSPTPVADLTRLRGDTALSAMIDIGVAASFFACIIGSGNAFVRIAFSMGREGILPTVLGRTHRRYATPHIATVALLTLLVFVPLIMVTAHTAPRTSLVALLTLSAFGYLTSYTLVCIATPTFLWRIGELTARPLLAGIVASLTMGTIIYAAFAATLSADSSVPIAFLLTMVAGWLLLGAIWLNDRTRLRNIGVYDETLTRDVYIGVTPYGNDMAETDGR
jgi:amino acid transporter